MTKTNILDLIGKTVKIEETAAPSRKEQRADAREELYGTNPVNIAELFNVLKSKGFGVGFTKKLYTDKGGDFLSGGEDAYTHARVQFSALQYFAIKFKLQAIAEAAESKKSAAYKEAENKFFAIWKDTRAEMGIEGKCTAADSLTIATFAAKYSYKSEYITDGIKYTPAALSTFILNVMKFLAAENTLENSSEAVSKRIDRLTK